MWRLTSHFERPLIGLAGLVLAACGTGEIGTSQSGAPEPGAYRHPAGKPISEKVDPATGAKTQTFPDGTIVITRSDGSQTITYFDGTTVEFAPDGSVVETIAPKVPQADPTQTISPEEAVETVWVDSPNSATSVPPGFNRSESLAAFEQTLYPLLRTHCSSCHSSDTADQLPLHSDPKLGAAHDAALGYVNLRQVPSSRLISRLAIDTHNCWSDDCGSDSIQLQDEIQRWTELLGEENLPGINVPTFDGTVTDELVRQWITRDRGSLPAEDTQYVRYASLHVLNNYGVSPDDMNTARAGLSKALNSTARYAPEIVNPLAIDEYSLVYRFDVRDYWGYARAKTFGSFPGNDSTLGPCLQGGNSAFGAPGEIEVRPECGVEVYERVRQGNVSVSEDDKTWRELGSPSNSSGFYDEYVEATQLVYTLSRPDVYNEIMQIPFSGAALESEVGVDSKKTYQFMTVNDAITISERLMWRAPIPDGYYWKSVDQFSTVDFVFYTRPIPIFTRDDNSQIITTPVLNNGDQGASTPNEYTGDTGAQAQAAEVIFSLPNGLQGYAIFGAGNQRRTDAFTFVVVDPRRIGEMPGVQPAQERFNFNGVRLLNGASCMGCHASGMNRAPDDMRPYIAANPAGEWTQHATAAEVEALYPGTAVMEPIIEADRNFFLNAEQKIANEMIIGTTDKNLYAEPISYMFEAAQRIYGYINTISN